MAGTHTVLLTLLPTVLVLTVLAGVESAAVKDVKDSKPQAGAFKRVFMPASDASNFFKRRGRRSPRTYEEYYEYTVLYGSLFLLELLRTSPERATGKSAGLQG
ncbi:unique cartilage matrix-associated protein-like [Sinocyclocheilus rhinocerous]|uniref:unique cartilage matrix-associated protein-like n=1 Tax=Sinocyclocheilus rhinocerous TaxID=307959 RepID=UPI0007BA3152|nr:PREDICTED: unique cartilage matrix-associated protein-like [Sinocyclocheilus rhinocerous]